MSSVTPRVTPRQWALATLLGASVAAAMWVARLEDAELNAEQNLAQPSRRPSPMPTGLRALNAPSTPLAPTLSERRVAMLWPDPSDVSRRAAWPALNVQRAAWSPPPSPPAPRAGTNRPPAAEAATTAVSAAAAPPFPYKLIGWLQQDGVPLALLADARRSAAAPVGQVFERDWRVEAVSASGLQLTWLPGPLAVTVAFSTP